MNVAKVQYPRVHKRLLVCARSSALPPAVAGLTEGGTK
jgi:hypothetical protein